MITSVTPLTSSIYRSARASEQNRSLGVVVIGKGNEGTSIVIEAQYPNRFLLNFRFGYLRFGASKPVWVGKGIAYSCGSDEPGYLKAHFDEVVAAANATELARKNAA